MPDRELNTGSESEVREFEKLFRSFFPGLVLFALKYVPDQDSAKEIVHTVFLNLWQKRGSLDTRSSLKSYLFTSVHNRCLNFLRDQKKFDRNESLLEKLDSPEFADGSDHLEAQELELQIFDALQSLPAKCREVFVLNRFDGMKYAEIADKLEISIKTVESQMSKALRLLREKLLEFLTILIFIILNQMK